MGVGRRACSCDLLGREAGIVDTGLAFDGRRSVLAKSNSCGVGDVADGRRLGIGEVLVCELPWLVRVGRLDSAMLAFHIPFTRETSKTKAFTCCT
jgi:hypothetical protein